jgi:hypothetical protein
MPKFSRKASLTFFLTSCSIVSFAQQFHVKSLDGLSPLPFASVLNITKGKLHFTNEEGILSTNLEIGDSLLITYVGYKNLRTLVSQSSQTFLLKQSDAILEPVRVQSCKNGINHEYSNLIEDTAERKFGGVCCWPKGATNARIAVMLKPDFNEARLDAFSVWLKKAFGAPKQSVQTPILFSFYSIDESSMLPGELLSRRQVIYYPKKEGKQTIKVDSLHLVMRKPGIYVGIEFVYNEKYEWLTHYIDTAKGVDSLVTQFGAQLDGIFSEDFTLAFYDYKNNSWSFAGRNDKSTLYRVHGTIKFVAELTTCKE